MRCRWPALAGLVLAVSCAARGPSPQLVALLDDADARVREGCYRCLEGALDAYERLLAERRPPATTARRGFAAAVLLAARAKELGVPVTPILDRAAALAARIGVSDPPGLAPAAYLAALDLIVGETSGMDQAMRQARTLAVPRARGADAPAEARVALDSAAPTDFVAQYLALAIDCENPRLRPTLKAETALAHHGLLPLIRYRVALCAIGAEPPARFRERDPRWVDTLFNEGRAQMAMRPEADVVKAVELFAAARAAFPTSTAITLALAHAQNMIAEYAAALANYDAVLADAPTHRDALLGRVMSLSYLSRHTEAVETASRMIDLGEWLIGDALYWRAWNRYHLYFLDDAWQDVEAAIKLLVNTNVYALAGTIAYARRELETAVDRFDRAFEMDKTNCEAAWTAGLVHVDQEAWPDAATKFSRAAVCFDGSAATARRDVARVEASVLAEPVRSRRIATGQKRIETAEHRRAQSAFNAAQSFVRVGDKASALDQIGGALTHPLLKDKAAALKAAIEKMP